MLVAFTLSMPGRNSWDGRWSGEDRLYVVVEKVSDVRASEIVAGGPYYYNWSDGWGARIDVRAVDGKEARKLRSKSAGFCGYEWMVNTIRLYGKPMADHEVSQHLSEQREQATAASK
jgi:hypothetical protein